VPKTAVMLMLFAVTLFAQESLKKDLIAFLESLTDQEFITNPGLANPWPR
jgi:hypothetical protein